MTKDLKDKTVGEIERIALELGQKKYLAGYVFTFIHTKDARTIADITPLSKAFRATLSERGYFISQLKTVETLTDADGSRKYLFELGDGERVEAVLLCDGQRRTLCVSTQVGCAMRCAFCATGRVKLRRSLTAGEIVEEVNRAEADAGKINNLVYMGMGEPFDNYDAVLRSVRILNDKSGKNIGIRHITVSTCGIAPAITKLAGEELRPRLAVSLNAPDDTLRSRLMPINRTYSLAKLFAAIRLYQDKTGQRVTFEYVLIDGMNDSEGHAKALIRRLRGIACNVNLIEHNPYPGCALVGSGRERIAQFATILKAAGFETVTRFKLGRRIKAACGQLQAGYGKR